jgi:hypothetical protein
MCGLHTKKKNYATCTVKSFNLDCSSLLFLLKLRIFEFKFNIWHAQSLHTFSSFRSLFLTFLYYLDFSTRICVETRVPIF